LAYQASLFARYATGVIIWHPDSGGTWRPSNYGAALYPGLEQEFSATLSPELDFKVNYDFLYSFLLDGNLGLADDLRLPMTPVHSLKASAVYHREGFCLSVTINYQSLRFLDLANSAHLNDHFGLDLFVRQALGEHLGLSLAIDNLFGAQYQQTAGYPMPPTKLRIALEGSW
jgi:outer membrane cobalamin receptor